VVDPLRPGGASVDTVADLLLLEQLPGVGPITVRRVVQYFGSAVAAHRAPIRDFARVAGREAAAARGGEDVRARVEGALRRAEELDIVALGWNDARYPADLWNLADPPPVLFVRGRVQLLAVPRAVCVVGARRATARGRDVAERLGVALGRADIVTVSGLALGVDGAVHAGALSVGGAAIAVLGCGPDVVYPRTHARLFRRVLEHGLIVSEFVPGTGAAPYHFPRRNRILAALGDVTVVVEAGRRSGSLITVDHALDMGREVWSVPGPIDSSTCAGSNRLLVDGARPLVSIGDFVSQIGRDHFGLPPLPVSAAHRAEGDRPEEAPGRDQRPPQHGAPEGEEKPHTASGGQDALEVRILGALAKDTLAIDEIAERFSVPVAKALALLTTLELHGEVERVGGMRFRRAA